jgi:hypothetical protein
VATRFSFDYGWCPPEDEMLETDLPFVSLWYAIGGEYRARNGGWHMTASDPPRSAIIASEPLTTHFSTWLEVPEYTMLTAELTPDGLARRMRSALAVASLGVDLRPCPLAAQADTSRSRTRNV